MWICGYVGQTIVFVACPQPAALTPFPGKLVCPPLPIGGPASFRRRSFLPGTLDVVALLCYNQIVRRKVDLATSALNALARMNKTDRRLVLEGIRTHLIQNDPVQVTRNKFPLRRPSIHSERELRLNDWRVFYTATSDGTMVLINLIGQTRNNKLFIAGEEFEL